MGEGGRGMIRVWDGRVTGGGGEAGGWGGRRRRRVIGGKVG